MKHGSRRFTNLCSEDYDIIRAFILVLDSEGLVRNINAKGCEVLGVAKKEAIGSDWFENFVPAEPRRHLRELFVHAITVSRRLEESFESPVLCRCGNERIIRWHASFVEDKKGTIQGLFCTGDDVTELRLGEKKLRQSEENYRTLIDNIYQVAFYVDFPEDLRKAYPHIYPSFVTSRVTDLTGYTDKDFKNGRVTFLNRIHADDRQDAAALFWRMIETRKPVKRCYRFRHKNGTYKWFEDSLVPKTDNTGKVSGCFGVISEVTERKVQQNMLKDYETFFSLFRDMMCMLGTDGYFKKVNSSFTRVLGYTEDELLSRKFFDFIHPDDLEKSLQEAEKFRQGHPVSHFENRYRTKDGTYRWLSWTSNPPNENGIGYAAARDITEQKSKDEQLRKNEAFLNSVVENIPNMIFVKDAKDLKFVRFNKAGEELLGFSREEMLGKNDYDFFPKDEADFFTKKDREVLNGKMLVDIPEEKILTRNKGKRLLHTKKIPIYDESGKPEYLLGISEDITEARQVQDALRKSEEKYRDIVRLIQEGIWVVDSNNKTTFVNDEMARMLNYTPEEMLGKGLYEFMDEEGVKIVNENLRRRKQRNAEMLDYKFKTKDGKDKWTILNSRPMKDASGKHTGAIAAVVDVTERRKNEEIIRESEHRLSEAQRIARLGTWEFNAETGDINWSEQTYRLCGLDPGRGKITRGEFFSLIHPDDRDLLTRNVNNALEKGIPFDMEMRVIWPDGSVHHLAGSGHPVTVNGRVVKLIGTGMDITERKMAELRVMKALVQGQDIERRRIAEDLHDSLGQKLSAIKIFVENHCEKGSRKSLDAARKLKQMLNETIEEVRSISYNLIPAALKNFGISHALRELCVKSNTSNATVVKFYAYEVEPSLDKTIEFGVYRLAQELLNNALKHAHASEVNVQLFQRDDSLILTVEDDGIGFNPQLVNLEKTLGMNSITSRTKALNGTLHFDSQPGSGTVATIEIPLKK